MDNRRREREFGRIYQRYYRRVVYYFSRQGLSFSESEELAQDTFFNGYRGLGEFRGEASYETWIFNIARNVLRNRFRRNTAKMRDGESVPLTLVRAERGAAGRPTDPPSGPDLHLLSSEKTKVLRGALVALPPQMRQCLLLRLDGDLKYREIADVLSISIDTVKSHLFQARQRLRTSVGPYFDAEDISVAKRL